MVHNDNGLNVLTRSFGFSSRLPTDLEDTNLDHVEELADLKLPTSFKITSTQIDSITNTRKMNTKLQQAKKRKEEAVITQKTISEHSLKRAETMQDVENAQEHRRLARIPMRSVNPARISPSHLKLKHTQELRSKRALDIVAANERKYVYDHTLAKDNEGKFDKQAMPYHSDSARFTLTKNPPFEPLTRSEDSVSSGWLVHKVPEASYPKAWKNMGVSRKVPHDIARCTTCHVHWGVGNRGGVSHWRPQQARRQQDAQNPWKIHHSSHD